MASFSKCCQNGTQRVHLFTNLEQAGCIQSEMPKWHIIKEKCAFGKTSKPNKFVYKLEEALMMTLIW